MNVNKIIITLLIVALLSACKGSKKDQEQKAILKFQETQYNFGTVKNGDTVRHVYKFKNEGKVPLIIKDAKVACDCTIPTWSKEPIPQGEKER